MSNSINTITVAIPSIINIDISKELINHKKGDNMASGTKSILLSADNHNAITELIKIGLKSIVASYVKDFKPATNQALSEHLNGIENKAIIDYITEEKTRGAKKSEYPQPMRDADYKLVISLNAACKRPIGIKAPLQSQSAAMGIAIEILEQLQIKIINTAEQAEKTGLFNDAVEASIRFADYLGNIIAIKKALAESINNEKIDVNETLSFN
jgi:hypothetical protein